MVNFYTVVGTDNMVRLSNTTTDPLYLVVEGERLLLDNPPTYTQLQKVIRIEPVPLDALEIPYEVVDDLNAIAASNKRTRRISSLEFIERFTDAEQLAIVSATLTTPQLKLWYDKLLAAGEVNFDDERTQAGMDVLVSMNFIDLARRNEILPPYVV